MKVLRVVIADDHRLFVEGLSAIVGGMNGQFKLELAGVAFDGSSLLELLKNVKTDLVFLDLNMPGRDGLEMIPEVKTKYPDVMLIVISGYGDPKLVRQCFKNGIDAYLRKSSGLKDLHKAIVEVSNGRSYWGEDLRLTPAKDERKRKVVILDGNFDDKFVIKQNLTRREHEVLSLISQAKSNKIIASELFISPETVSVHRKNIMRKLGVNSTASLIKFAMDHNLI